MSVLRRPVAEVFRGWFDLNGPVLGPVFYVFESVSTNQDGQEVVRGTWTNIVRGI